MILENETVDRQNRCVFLTYYSLDYTSILKMDTTNTSEKCTLERKNC
jgi:hypothetical protein